MLLRVEQKQNLGGAVGDGKTVNVHEGLKRVDATFKAIGVLWLIGWLAAYMARSLSPAASYVFDIYRRDWALWLRYRSFAKSR